MAVDDSSDDSGGGSRGRCGGVFRWWGVSINVNKINLAYYNSSFFSTQQTPGVSHGAARQKKTIARVRKRGVAVASMSKAFTHNTCMFIFWSMSSVRDQGLRGSLSMKLEWFSMRPPHSALSYGAAAQAQEEEEAQEEGGVRYIRFSQLTTTRKPPAVRPSAHRYVWT